MIRLAVATRTNEQTRAAKTHLRNQDLWEANESSPASIIIGLPDNGEVEFKTLGLFDCFLSLCSAAFFMARDGAAYIENVLTREKIELTQDGKIVHLRTTIGESKVDVRINVDLLAGLTSELIKALELELLEFREELEAYVHYCTTSPFLYLWMSDRAK